MPANDSHDPNESAPGSRGRPVRICQTLPPITLRMEAADGLPEPPPASRGKPVRVCVSLPPVTLRMEAVPPALVLFVAGEAHAAVADAVLEAVSRDRAAGGPGLTRDPARDIPRAGFVTLVLVPNGPVGPDTADRLRAVARALASPTVSAEVIPAA